MLQKGISYLYAEKGGLVLGVLRVKRKLKTRTLESSNSLALGLSIQWGPLEIALDFPLALKEDKRTGGLLITSFREFS